MGPFWLETGRNTFTTLFHGYTAETGGSAATEFFPLGDRDPVLCVAKAS